MMGNEHVAPTSLLASRSVLLILSPRHHHARPSELGGPSDSAPCVLRVRIRYSPAMFYIRERPRMGQGNAA